ncbi:MAG: hypothetical protein OEZ25_06045 [Candidatus Bathyarchaeota archaeon]|nr:hypothetical protein [Candidatus Bathyarchaeota archaeon]
MPEWECLSCHYKWVDEGKIEPKFCPKCGAQFLYAPGDTKRITDRGLEAVEKYRAGES